MIAIIDADSIVYVLAYQYKDEELTAERSLLRVCDEMIHRILADVKATHYIGSFSPSRTFRHDVYKYAPYKGTRKPKDEWMIKWELIIKTHLKSKWGFFVPDFIEADDVLSGLASLIDEDIVLCSPDKDLLQVVGHHYNYRKPADGTLYIDKAMALQNFWSQMLTGDSSDNVKGIPGLGDVKVKLLFKTMSEQLDFVYMQCVREQYFKAFGQHYGTIIYEETLATLQLLQKGHPLWEQFKSRIDELQSLYMRPVPAPIEFEMDSTMLKQMGWT